MKSLTFNRNSWHYKLVNNTTASLRHRTEVDICTYARYTVGGILVLTFVGILLASLGFIAWNVILGIVFSIIYGTIMFTDVAILGIVLYGGVGLIFGTSAFIEWKQERSLIRATDSYKKQDSFLSNAYKSWKNKFCTRIEFID